MLGGLSLIVLSSMIRSSSVDQGIVPDRVRQALDTLAEGLLVLDEEERIVLANQAFAQTCKLDPQELIGRTASSLSWTSNEATSRGDFPWIRSLVDNRPQIDQQLQLEVPDGGRKVFSVNSSPIINANGARHGALATFRDVTEMEEHRAQLENMLVMLQSSRDEISRKNRELEILATQDALTGCLNRRAFFDRFSRAWDQAGKNGVPLSCVMVDNDHFKSVNDTYGHHVGDDVLRAVAATLRKLNGPPNLVCRYGGEEFCVLLPGKNLSQAQVVAEQMRKTIESIRFKDPEKLRLTASIGVSELKFGARDPQELINQADKCLYIAKRTGRNRVIAYDPVMEDVEIDSTKTSRTKPTDETLSIPYPAVSALLSALGYRDAETAEHSRRVAELAVAAADGLLGHHDTYVLEIAALLHDVGKVGVPDHILLKSDPLSDDEWDIMRRHQRVGIELVVSTFGNEKLEKILRMFRCPYAADPKRPGRPHGEAIDLGARLLAIADSFDSMVSDHVYRPAMTLEQASLELRRCAGTQFDPKLVERFIERTRIRWTQAPMVVPKIVTPQTAIQLGVQLERLADALDHQDLAGLAALAGRLRATAEHANLRDIVATAAKLESQAARQNEPIIEIVSLTTELLQMCRSTQAQISMDLG
jgi:diguanylate cyclase (GGDEF)-like protein/PAS domain S-box-containing protein/putative nucleotidyltransferase with HDIG domain